MSSISRRDPLEVLMDTYLAELLELTDEQVLDGEDPAAVQAEGLALLEAARVEAGRRRLAAARERLSQSRGTETPVAAEPVTAAQARAALRQVAAANEGRYTLAARQLDEMADEDVIRAYLQLKQLERDDGNGPTE